MSAMKRDFIRLPFALTVCDSYEEGRIVCTISVMVDVASIPSSFPAQATIALPSSGCAGVLVDLDEQIPGGEIVFVVRVAVNAFDMKSAISLCGTMLMRWCASLHRATFVKALV